MTRPRLPHPVRLALAAAAAVTTLASCAPASHSAASIDSQQAAGNPTSPPQVATIGAPAPAGSFTALDGTTVDVASYRGTPTVLWFIAADCSSCTASIPAVARNLNTLRAAGVHVAVIDLYGDLGQGPTAQQALAAVQHKLAGAQAAEPGWTWGISTRDLSFRFDPDGAPDIYYVMDRAGRLTYRNSVPVSTMSDLIAHARAAATA